MSRPQSSKNLPLLIVGGVVLVAGLVVGATMLLQPPPVKVTLELIAKQTIDEEEVLTVTPVAHVVGAPEKDLKYRLIAGPKGSKINPRTGVFTWQPSEAQGPESHPVELGVATTGTQKVQASRKFTIVVNEVNTAPVILDVGEQTVAAGETLKFLIRASDSDEPPQALEYRFGKAVPTGARLDPNSGSFEWTPPESSKEHDEPVDVIVAESDEQNGLKSDVKFKIHVTARAK